MSPPNSMMVSLGFTSGKVPVGTHICHIYSDDMEREEALLQYLVSGLKSNERVACFSEKVNEASLSEQFSHNGLSYVDLSHRGACCLSGTREVYFQGNRFDPDRMLTLLTDFYKETVQTGYSASRVIGEMLPEIRNIAGGERLLEYESKVSLLVRDIPVTSVCQYDARAFDGATIMDVLKVHPHMVVKGAIINNPFYIPPEEFLK